MTAPDPVKRAWQSSVTAPSLPPLDHIRAEAEQFYRKVRTRNRIEYVASVLVIVVFTGYAFFLPAPTARLGAALVVIGTLFVMWQLHRRASATPPPTGEISIMAHQRAAMARQRDALAGVFRWYLLPFVPGLLTMVVGPAVESALRHGYSWKDAREIAGALLVHAGLFGFIWWLNQRAARKLQKAIDEIDALTGETE